MRYTYTSSSFLTVPFLVVLLIFLEFLISTMFIFFAWTHIIIQHAKPYIITGILAFFFFVLKSPHVVKQCIDHITSLKDLYISFLQPLFYSNCGHLSLFCIIGPRYGNQSGYSFSFLSDLIEALFFFTFLSKLNLFFVYWILSCCLAFFAA